MTKQDLGQETFAHRQYLGQEAFTHRAELGQETIAHRREARSLPYSCNPRLSPFNSTGIPAMSRITSSARAASHWLARPSASR